VAQATTKRDASGKLLQEGITWGPDGQGHAWWRECLNRQNGLVPMSEDRKKLNWTDPLGVEAFTWYTDQVTKLKVAEKGFVTDDPTAFKTGHTALTVDGNFRISTLKSDAPTLNYGIAPLPEHKKKATFASFWCNSITRKAGDVKGDRFIAAALEHTLLPSALPPQPAPTAHTPARTAPPQPTRPPRQRPPRLRSLTPPPWPAAVPPVASHARQGARDQRRR